LSYGERKRCQIGGAAASGTEVLILDEPTNHLDSGAREAVAAAMGTFEGVGILISHDIDLLDRFCRQILFLPEGIGMPGNFTQTDAQRNRLTLEAAREREAARAEMSRLRNEAARRRSLAAEQQKRRSKKGLDLKDSDGRARLDLVRISGKDGTGGKLLRQMDGALKQAEARLTDTSPQRRTPTGITVRGLRSGADTLWKTNPKTLFYNGRDGAGLTLPELEIDPGDRIVVSGVNGTGKSTLLHHILSEAGGRAWLLEQEFGQGARKDLMGRFNRLDREEAGRVVSSVCRMGSDPELFLSSEDWSPGECKKAAVALALEDRLPDCQLLLLDEPMNHLDIEARRLLTEALDGFTGAVVAVTHEPLLQDRWKAGNWILEHTAAGAVLKIL
jgi:ATPase subunit of ABC transporter with duplicated ATPase domains